MAEKPDCAVCETLYGNEDPPCEECLPVLLPANQQIYEIFNMAQSQHIIAFNKIIGLRLNPIFHLLELYEVEDKKRYLELMLKAHKAMYIDNKGNK